MPGDTRAVRNSPRSAHRRLVFFLIGCVAVVLGVIGIFLPLLPTTPFLLVASACFARSSARCHAWLLSRPRLGPVIRDWERSGAIRTGAKVQATALLWLVLGATIALVPVVAGVKIAVAAVGVAVTAFLWTRPSPEAGGSGPAPG